MQQFYEVHPSQLRWAMHNLSAAGVPIQGYSTLPNGMCVIVITLPESTPAPDWRAVNTARRPKPRIELGPVLRWAAVLAAVVAVAAVLYFAFAGGGNTVTAEVGGMRLDPVTGHMVEDGGVWDWFANLHLPWQQDAAQPSQPQGDGWQWPWDAAVQRAQDTVTLAAGATLAVLVWLIVLALVRKRR